MAKFQLILYKQQELTPNGVWPKGLRQLFGDAARHGVAAFGITGQSIPEYMQEHGICPDSVLVIAASDRTLCELAGLPVASAGYKTEAFFSDGLYAAGILVESFQGANYRFLERVYQRRHGIPWRVIETGRCYLREMALFDLPELYALYQNPGFSRFLRPLGSLDEEEAYIKHMYGFYGFGMWLAKDRFTDELLGRAGFGLSDQNGETILEMGYAIAPSRQRQGYATEVCQAMLAYAASEEWGFSAVHCFVRAENRASAALLGKLGFLPCGECLRDGERLREYVYSLP